MVIGLIEGRHKIETVENYIFNEVPVDKIFDFKWQTEIINLKLKNARIIHLYVTGLTVCLVSVINYCKQENKKITLWHYNRDTGEYIRQNVF